MAVVHNDKTPIKEPKKVKSCNIYIKKKKKMNKSIIQKHGIHIKINRDLMRNFLRLKVETVAISITY